MHQKQPPTFKDGSVLMSKTRYQSVLGFGLLVAIGFAATPTSAQQTTPGTILPESDLIDALRRGGYVIYFRHAATNPEQADTNDPKLGRCEAQRNLSADGPGWPPRSAARSRRFESRWAKS